MTVGSRIGIVDEIKADEVELSQHIHIYIFVVLSVSMMATNSHFEIPSRLFHIPSLSVGMPDVALGKEIQFNDCDVAHILLSSTTIVNYMLSAIAENKY